MRRRLLLFVKNPVPGAVKTRLGAAVGEERAAQIYRALVAEVCARIPPDLEVAVLFAPPDSEPEIRAWLAPQVPVDSAFISQCEGDLGARLRHAFDHAFAQGADFLAAIGSDCIDIEPHHFAKAWGELEAHDVVLGPAQDGGYYLVALKAPPGALFEETAWSSAATLAQTHARADVLKLSVALLPMLSDVDSLDDWQRVAHRFAHGSSADGINTATDL